MAILEPTSLANDRVDTELITRRYSRDEYYRLSNAEVLDDIRVELVNGQIFEMSPTRSPRFK